MIDPSQLFIGEGLSVMRWLNTIQAEWFGREERFATKDELLGANGLLKDIRRYKRGTRNGDFLAKFNLESTELYQGWNFDFASTADGYVIVLIERASKSDRAVFTTDHIGAIYRGVTSGEGAPSAHDLASPGAKGFPGVVPYVEFREPGFGGLLFGATAALGLKMMLQGTEQCASCCYWSNGTCTNGPGGGCVGNPACCCMFNCGAYPNCAWCLFRDCGAPCCCGGCNSMAYQCTQTGGLRCTCC
jgi:hypothetical protein